MSCLGFISVKDVSNLSNLSYGDLVPLLGRAEVDNGQLSVSPGGYQQFVQIVPGSVSANGPDYSAMLAFLLSQRGVQAYRSQMTLGAVGSNAGAVSCAQGEEYFIYSLNTLTTPHALIGTTKLNATIYGAFLDCSAQSRNASFSGEASKTIPTTKSAALTYASLLALAWPKMGWTSINSGIAAAGGFADMDPSSLVVQSAVAESALRNLVE